MTTDPSSTPQPDPSRPAPWPPVHELSGADRASAGDDAARPGTERPAADGAPASGGAQTSGGVPASEPTPADEQPTDVYPAWPTPSGPGWSAGSATEGGRTPEAGPATYGRPAPYGQPEASGRPASYGQPGPYGSPAAPGASSTSYGQPAAPGSAMPYGQPATAGAAPAPGAPARRRGPSWPGVIALVAAGCVLSTAGTLGAVAGYDALTGDGATSASSSSSTGTHTGSSAGSSAPAAASGDGWESVAASVSESTVAIEVATAGGAAEGTGIIRDDKGDIITNNHVVAGASTITVTLSDGRAYSAQLVGTDPSTDLAVIRLDSPPSGLTPATFADSSDISVGAPVMAVGTPLGLENTVTTGIISAVHRPVTTLGEAQDQSDAAYTSALQTDAAINPGNSGGPLVDSAGQVIGVTSSIAGLATADSATQSGSIGLGFAIPSSTVTLITDQILADGSAQHAQLGVTASDGTQEKDGATYSGAQVRSTVDGGAAAQGGIRAGDLIVDVDGVPTDGAAALTGYVRSLAVGSQHTVKVLRDGAQQDVTVTLTRAS